MSRPERYSAEWWRDKYYAERHLRHAAVRDLRTAKVEISYLRGSSREIECEKPRLTLQEGVIRYSELRDYNLRGACFAAVEDIIAGNDQPYYDDPPNATDSFPQRVGLVADWAAEIEHAVLEFLAGELSNRLEDSTGFHGVYPLHQHWREHPDLLKAVRSISRILTPYIHSEEWHCQELNLRIVADEKSGEVE